MCLKSPEMELLLHVYIRCTVFLSASLCVYREKMIRIEVFSADYRSLSMLCTPTATVQPRPNYSRLVGPSPSVSMATMPQCGCSHRLCCCWLQNCLVCVAIGYTSGMHILSVGHFWFYFVHHLLLLIVGNKTSLHLQVYYYHNYKFLSHFT